MAEVRMRTFGDLEGDLNAIMGEAMECLDYRIPKAVEDRLRAIILICKDWLEWMNELEEYQKRQKERGGGE